MSARWAVYFAPPPGSPLWRRAAAWLGRDPSGAPVAQVAPPAGLDAERFAAATASPRRYGFHGTLKPPFALAAGAEAEELRRALATLAGEVEAFTLPPLRVGAIGGFLALLPIAPCPPLHALAARCVAEIDAFRSDPGEAELARRRGSGLTAEEEALLRRWGYPYVMQRFRFHMTLSERLPDAERGVLAAAAEAHFAEALAEPLPCDALSLFHQPAAAEPFVLAERFPLQGAAGP